MIGICGLEHGCGTTCVSLLLSNYVCSKLRKKTAYIELNATNQIQSISKKSDTQRFSHLGITFFPNITLLRLSDILLMDFEYFILDMGVLNTHTAYEFNRCHKQFMVGSLCEWKLEKTKSYLEQLNKNTTIHQECITFLGNPLIKESLCSKHFLSFSRVIPFPYIKNPFQITSKEFLLCETLLERN